MRKMPPPKDPHARCTRRAVLAALLGPWTLGWAGAAQAVGEEAEYRIKAAFLCKFGHYIDWPPVPPGTPFDIGVVANDEVVDLVQRVASGQTVQGRPITVRRIAVGDDVDGLSVVFVARSHLTRLPKLLDAVQGKPVLTVSEAEGENGAMVNFVVVEDKVKFDVALRRVEPSPIKISARLLSVARQVTGRSM